MEEDEAVVNTAEVEVVSIGEVASIAEKENTGAENVVVNIEV